MSSRAKRKREWRERQARAAAHLAELFGQPQPGPREPGRDIIKIRHGPGIWEDVHGRIHWSITELLALVDLEDTPANREVVVTMLQDLMRKANGNQEPLIVYREKPDDDQSANPTN